MIGLSNKKNWVKTPPYWTEPFDKFRIGKNIQGYMGNPG
jgi:hypothetical protein